ncbi:hypothetical protein L1O59_001167 [Salmonella enterica]|nr:hypothetical protein [Salmonella enterica]EBQ9476148.1 hypothetical protein [Salmonella enterica subsp. enterica serovar Kokomlemle]ECD6157790.1 hypothetical protein [Salmonella enterica subsp. enterica]ECU7991857.1 hypothetical protein [Salmonella enterica subsp. enterica serovar Toucra]EAW3062516.1 hypothetical protein [Salmonella enterica]
MNSERLKALKANLKGAPLDAREAVGFISDLIKASSFLVTTAGYAQTGNILMGIAQDYAELVTEMNIRDVCGGDHD